MDSEFKAKTLQGLDPITPVLGGILPRRPVRWSPNAAIFRAQDTIPASSWRIVAEWSLSGANAWAQPRGSDDPGTPGAGDPQNYPEDDWRTLAIQQAHVTPGSELRAYAVASPSGLVVQDPGGGFYSQGAWAEVRVAATFSNGASTTGPHYKSAAIPGSPSGTYTGFEGTEPGENWSNTLIVDIGRLRPPEYLSDPAVAAAYSEWSDAEIVIGIRGGARVQQVVVYEQPIAHVTDHDNSGLTSVHAMPETLLPLTPGPLTRAPDGATYDENRFGTLRAMQVAERQSERLGPRIMHGSAYDETDANIWNQAEANPITTSSPTFVHWIDSSITTYTVNTPGAIVAGAHAKLARLCAPVCIGRNEIAAVPARVTIDASRSVADCVVRFQSGLYDWIDVSVTGGRAIYTMTGYLQSQVHPDHAGPPLVLWIRALAGGTLSLFSWSVDFGHWAS